MSDRSRLFSILHLPAGPWSTVLECLVAHFPHISATQWQQRMEQGKVTGADGCELTPLTPYKEGLRVHYLREVEHEVEIPFRHRLLYQDEHLLVVDKPHFLPVIPRGRFVEQSLLRRLVRETGNTDLVPLHRLDRLTAGVMLFSTERKSRGAYQALFAQRQLEKVYEALAPALPQQHFPLEYASRLEKAEPFFRMAQVEGEANSWTRIEVLERGSPYWLYRLMPITGRKHQLRVQMASLGAGIAGDPWYPKLREDKPEDFRQPLQLLARSLSFIDPLTGQERFFVSQRQLVLDEV